MRGVGHPVVDAPHQQLVFDGPDLTSGEPAVCLDRGVGLPVELDELLRDQARQMRRSSIRSSAEIPGGKTISR